MPHMSHKHVFSPPLPHSQTEGEPPPPPQSQAPDRGLITPRTRNSFAGPQGPTDQCGHHLASLTLFQSHGALRPHDTFLWCPLSGARGGGGATATRRVRNGGLVRSAAPPCASAQCPKLPSLHHLPQPLPHAPPPPPRAQKVPFVVLRAESLRVAGGHQSMPPNPRPVTGLQDFRPLRRAVLGERCLLRDVVSDVGNPRGQPPGQSAGRCPPPNTAAHSPTAQALLRSIRLPSPGNRRALRRQRLRDGPK